MQRPIRHTFRVSESEEAVIQAKFQLSEMENFSDFIREIVLLGLIVEADSEQLTALEKLLSKISQNVNQIARRVNATGNLYREDIDEIKEGVNEIWQQQASILSLLQRVRH